MRASCAEIDVRVHDVGSDCAIFATFQIVLKGKCPLWFHMRLMSGRSCDHYGGAEPSLSP
jgi:hypothetical protein